VKKLISFLSVVAVLATFGATPAFPLASSKFAAEVSDITLIRNSSSNAAPKTVLRTTIKTPNKKDLLIGVSLETALFTQTQVKSKGGTPDSASASATLEVSVLLDGKRFNPTDRSGAFPPKVVFDKRAQTLSATLGGFQSCVDLNGDGVIDVATECTLTDEEIELILDTMAAHHFNFMAANLPPGNHTLEVQVGIGVDTSFGAGSASATAGVGRGSLTVEEVRAINQVVPGAGIEFDFLQ